jgi:hypothetical protein
LRGLRLRFSAGQLAAYENNCMIDVNFFGISLFIGLIVLATLAGISLSARAGWGERALVCGLPLATGLAFGPFLLGLAAIAVLLALPGRPAAVHLTVIAMALAAAAAFGFKPFAGNLRAASFARPPRLTAVTLSVCGAAALLLMLAIFTPLTQNDALEYEIVARRMFELRALSDYPMTDPASEPSGFFAPWTHPPLYPALLYLSQIAQGHADSPALERLIAPWALIAAGGIAAALARMSGVRAGGLAFLAMLAPPLAFLGAAGALIDALTMLGMALTMALVCAGGRRSARSAVVTGLALGAGLWAHSQAILFLPIFAAAILLQNLRNDGKPGLQNLFLTLATAILLGGWPYLWNVLRFGAMASDALALVAPDVLRWNSYFAIDRGIASIPARIVYGLFKVFSAPEAYGLLFATACGGAVLTLRARGNKNAVEADGPHRRNARLEPALTAIAVSAAYLAGVGLTLAAGLTDLVKNERYLLIIAPPAAVLSAIFLRWFAEKAARLLRWAGAGRGPSRMLAYGALSAGFLLQFVFLSAFALNRNGLMGSALGRPFETTLSQRGETALTYFLRRQTPAGSITLSLKPADMYYAERRMISHFDPRLEDFYNAKSADEASARLAALDVGFVHAPNYAIPTFYNSWLKELLADPERSALLFETDSGQIYGLSPASLAVKQKTNIGLESWPWEKAQGFVFGGRKRFARVSGGFSSVLGLRIEHGGPLAAAFSRHAYAVLRMGEAGKTKPAAAAPETEFVARFVLSGVCHVSVFKREHGPSDGGEGEGARLLATAIVESQTSPLSLPVRFRTGPQTTGLSFELLLSGDCMLDVQKAELLQYAAK